MKWKLVLIILAGFVILSMPALQALNIGFGSNADDQKIKAVLGVISAIFVNSTDFWDNLDTPADILLNDLGDVIAPSPGDGDVLIFDNSTGTWIPGSAGSVVGINGSLNNTNIAYTNVSNIFMADQDIEGNLNVTGNLTGRDMYGSMWFNNISGRTVSLTATNNPKNFTNLNSGYENGFIFDGDHTLTTEHHGIYKVEYTLSISGGSNKVYQIFFVIDGNRVPEGTAHHTARGVGNIDTITGNFITEINVSEQIWLEVEQITANIDDPVFTHLSLTTDGIDLKDL